MKPRTIESLDSLPASAWDALAGDQPFLSHAFLNALELSGCASPNAGWHPRHLLWETNSQLVGALPIYLKTHSYGEYVFDWRWAEAYQRAGMSYYPKLICALPFTPVPGPRVLTGPRLKSELIGASLDYLKNLVRQQGLSSLHLLFAGEEELVVPPSDRQLLHRQSVRFVWRNRGYRNFEEFLEVLRSARRKQIRRERRRVIEQGISIQRLCGGDIDEQAMDFFLQCYQHTYLRRSGHRGYLNRDFFRRIRTSMSDRMMLVTALQADTPIASALFFFDRHQLYGRYWGSLSEIDSLHFELCYYQGIEFCIERSLSCFDPGTQGEHKLARGFEPQRTHSLHWIADPRFHAAIAQSIAQEEAYTHAYHQVAAEHLPFRQA